MVRYQDDLSTLQDMLQVTMDKIPERFVIVVLVLIDTGKQ